MRMDGLPILADDDLRQAVSPRKTTQPLHRSLSIDDNLDDQNYNNDNFNGNTSSPNNPTTKIINEYRSLGGVTGVSLNPQKNKWNPPPLPIEQMYDNYSDNGDDEDEGNRSDVDYGEDDSRNETMNSSFSQDDELIRDALQVFY
eukprot:CAMPEP_0174826560 /NCGR_PEP_ID=MMETSP1107-20130205/44241_1 /TAXON_ID=36770 /ORGANISM="Paraphysomonas vestita, Strain GFlagA" /LENGTH=143 /DNA_ID=CAMNT_0016060015 /DNA_START=1145 /DNA_END=1573 /DNA_ORIENTATION=+